MIDFTQNVVPLTLTISEQERACGVVKVNNLMRAEFQARLIDTTTATVGNIQTGDTKINLKAFAEKDLYLLAWCIVKIDGEERWEKWKEAEKIQWLKSWATAFPNEFEKAVETVKNTCGDLL